ncbi:MAG: hypothetical protein BWX84_00198 [Verrucomicrobia bacterium ADurb.Bin118]|nr:MAG: hypothetical protein BWX84_00198 [Verrucomicrobia bacterium ADurb.Bin118]
MDDRQLWGLNGDDQLRQWSIITINIRGDGAHRCAAALRQLNGALVRRVGGHARIGKLLGKPNARPVLRRGQNRFHHHRGAGDRRGVARQAQGGNGGPEGIQRIKSDDERLPVRPITRQVKDVADGQRVGGVRQQWRGGHEAQHLPVDAHTCRSRHLSRRTGYPKDHPGGDDAFVESQARYRRRINLHGLIGREDGHQLRRIVIPRREMRHERGRQRASHQIPGAGAERAAARAGQITGQHHHFVSLFADQRGLRRQPHQARFAIGVIQHGQGGR